MYPAYASVVVKDPASYYLGEAGAVVSVPATPEEKIKVRLDKDNTVHEFDQSQIQGL